MNLVVLCGHMAKDGELRTTKDGHSVFSFTLAVKRKFPKDEQIDEADFINCSSFGKIAESMAKYTKKGNKILVQGRLQIRKYQDAMGETKYATNVLCDSCTFLTKNQEDEETPIKAIEQPKKETPITNTSGLNPKEDEWGDVLAITDDDLPF